LSLELQYERGHFCCALTRGNGIVGDDVTANVRGMRGFVPTLTAEWGPCGNLPFTGGVRGEVIMHKDIHRSHYPTHANCRNTVNGILKRKDGRGRTHLHIVCYDAVPGTPGKPFTGSLPFADETEKLAWLARQGFVTVHSHRCANAQEVVALRSEIMRTRELLPYSIDGLVVKSTDLDFQDAQLPRPKKQIAFKFSTQEAITTLRDVQWQTSGVTYTPIGITDPVRLAGTTVKRANLCNPNMLTKLCLKIGSHVLISKRGEIIPKIEALVSTPAHAQEIHIPTQCTSCNTVLENSGSRLFCPNVNCPLLSHHRITRWIECLEIKHVGTELIQRLFEEKKVRRIPDLYTLTCEDLIEIEHVGNATAKKILEAIHHKKEIALQTFIAGFGIEGIGETMGEKLICAGFDTLEKVLHATTETLESIYQFGTELAKSVVTGIARVKDDMCELLDRGFVRILAKQQAESPLRGKSFCFSGSLRNGDRATIHRIRALGGVVRTSVTRDLSYLIFESLSQPYRTAQKLKKEQGVALEIISEDEFCRLLDQASASCTHTGETVHPLQGKSFYFSGASRSMNHKHAQEKVRALGGDVASSVTAQLDYLVFYSQSTRYRTACALGIQIISEETLHKLIATAQSPLHTDAHVHAPLHGMSFCFSGDLDGMTRAQAIALVQRLGGTVKTAVSTQLTYLVSNDPHGQSRKCQNAVRCGVRIISEHVFLALCTPGT
uniref:NAD-dependent DNA ligase LigA n=1 Tax=Treponema pallidum TaxID=160 RepID=UPI00158925BE